MASYDLPSTLFPSSSLGTHVDALHWERQPSEGQGSGGDYSPTHHPYQWNSQPCCHRSSDIGDFGDLWRPTSPSHGPKVVREIPSIRMIPGPAAPGMPLQGHGSSERIHPPAPSYSSLGKGHTVYETRPKLDEVPFAPSTLHGLPSLQAWPSLYQSVRWNPSDLLSFGSEGQLQVPESVESVDTTNDSISYSTRSSPYLSPPLSTRVAPTTRIHGFPPLRPPSQGSQNAVAFIKPEETNEFLKHDPQTLQNSFSGTMLLPSRTKRGRRRAASPDMAGRGKRFRCEYCDRRFEKKSNLEEHVKTHGSKKIEVRCTKPGCNKTYRRQADVNRHVRTSHENKSHTCTDCGKSFKRSDSVIRHWPASCPEARRRNMEQPNICQYFQNLPHLL